MRKLNQRALKQGNIILEPLDPPYKAVENLMPSHVYFDRQQNCWLSTFNGVFKLSKQGRLEMFNIQNGLPANSICSVFR
jgi:hypothetical protein